MSSNRKIITTGLMDLNMKRGTMFIIESLTGVAIGLANLIDIIVTINRGMITIITSGHGRTIETHIVIAGTTVTILERAGGNVLTVQREDLIGRILLARLSSAPWRS